MRQSTMVVCGWELGRSLAKFLKSGVQVYRDPGFTIVQHGKELHSWQVLLNGVLEVREEGLPPKLLHVGDSFGMPAATQV